MRTMFVSQSRHGLATGAVLASCASVQVGSALAARLMPFTGSEGATMLRLCLAALGLLALSRPRVGSWSGMQWKSALMLGLSLVGMNGCFYLALARIPLGTAVTFELVGPLTLSAVLSRRPRDLLWVGWALAGVVMLGGAPALRGDGLDPVGIAFAGAAGTFWALYILATAKVGAHTPGLGGLAVATAAAALVAIPFGLSGASVVLSHPELAGLAVGTALLASMIPYSLELGAMRSLSPKTFGVLLSLEPAVAALAGWLILGQAIDGWGAVGIAMVISASVGTTLTASPRIEVEPAAA